MRLYKLDPEKFPRVRRNIFLTYLVLSLVGLAVVYFYFREALFGEAWVLVPFVLLVFTAAGWFAMRERRKYWEEFTLTVRDNTLIHSAHKAPEIRIKRSQITRVREVRNGLILSTQDRENMLLIPRDLPDEDYQEIKGMMQRWAGQGT